MSSASTARNAKPGKAASGTEALIEAQDEFLQTLAKAVDKGPQQQRAGMATPPGLRPATAHPSLQPRASWRSEGDEKSCASSLFLAQQHSAPPPPAPAFFDAANFNASRPNNDPSALLPAASASGLPLKVSPQLTILDFGKSAQTVSGRIGFQSERVAKVRRRGKPPAHGSRCLFPCEPLPVLNPHPPLTPASLQDVDDDSSMATYICSIEGRESKDGTIKPVRVTARHKRRGAARTRASPAHAPFPFNGSNTASRSKGTPSATL